MRVLLVTTWGTACGIAEHSAYLKEAVEAADPGIEIIPHTDLHPESFRHVADIDLVWLNYHAALLSQWTPEWIRRWQQSAHVKIGVTYHDSGTPNTQQAKDVCAAADAFVVHEPYDDLEGDGRYWRQGVPDWASPMIYDQSPRSWCGNRPIVGTVGFPFPWKNYDLLCEASALAGWATFLIAPGATPEQRDRWLALNPHTNLYDQFLGRDHVGALLAGCDATAFLYSCQNGGTSGAIRQGIAARKPVLATLECRQFRDLQDGASGLAQHAITWLPDLSVDGVSAALATTRLQRVDPMIVALAERDRWPVFGAAYASLYRSLAHQETR